MPDLIRGRGSPRMLAAAAAEPVVVLADLQTASGGLTSDEASRRLATHGPNLVAEHARVGSWQVLGQAIANPLVVLLAVLAGSSVAGGDRASAAVMCVMLGIGVGLRFVQESRAGRAAVALRDLVRVHATVLRDGVPVELPLDGLVPGDIVQLAAGDMVPADVRLVSSKDLSVSQAVLSGESFPVDKHVAPEGAAGRHALDLASLCWLGSNVASGTATAVVIATGRATLLGSVAASLEPPEAPTAFDIGMQRLTWLLVAFVAVLVPLVFVLTLATKHDWATAAFFSLAVGVGLTPEMLPIGWLVSHFQTGLRSAMDQAVLEHEELRGRNPAAAVGDGPDRPVHSLSGAHKFAVRHRHIRGALVRVRLQ